MVVILNIKTSTKEMNKIEDIKKQVDRLQKEYDSISKHIQYISLNPTNADEIKYMQQRDVSYWKKQFEDVRANLFKKKRELKCCIDENACIKGLNKLNVEVNNTSLEKVLMNIDVRYNNKYTKVAKNLHTGDIVIQTMAWLNLFEPVWDVYKESPNRNMIIQTEADYVDAIATKYAYYDSKLAIFKNQDEFRKNFSSNYIKILDVGSLIDGKFVHMTELCEQNGTLWMSADIMIYVKKYSDVGIEALDDEWDKYNLVDEDYE